MEGYRITLKNEKLRQYSIISWVFIVFVIVAAIWVSINVKQTGLRIILYVLVPSFLVLYFQSRFVSAQAAKKVPLFRLPVLFLVVPWILLEIYWVAIAVLLFSLLQAIATRRLEVEVDKNRLLYPSYPRQQFIWNELNQVILKDGLLTIDLKNNKLIQQEIDESKQAIDQKEFNEFCTRQLITNR